MAFYPTSSFTPHFQTRLLHLLSFGYQTYGQNAPEMVQMEHVLRVEVSRMGL